jgi:hypothetical protein
MTTLERLEKLEQELKMLTTVLASVPKMQGTTGDVKLIETMNLQLQQVHSFNQLIVQRQMSLEQTLTSLAKTISCTVDELESKQVISGNDVMVRLRKLDENAERNRIQQMIQLKLIKPASFVTEESIIVLSQKVVRGEQEEIVAEYRVIELPAKLTPKELIADFVGKVVGDVLEQTHEQETLISKIENIYDIVSSGTLSEADIGSTEQVVG